MLPVIVARLLRSTGRGARAGRRRVRPMPAHGAPRRRARGGAARRAGRRRARGSGPGATSSPETSPAATSARASSMIASDVIRPGYVAAASSCHGGACRRAAARCAAAVGFVGRRRRRTFTASVSCSRMRSVASSRFRICDRSSCATARTTGPSFRARAHAPPRSARSIPQRRTAPRRGSSSSVRAGRPDRSSARTGTRSPTE